MFVKRLYRGYLWLNTGAELEIHVGYPNTYGYRLLAKCAPTRTPENSWKIAHRQRKAVPDHEGWMSDVSPVDAVWEIHEIEDETAYQAALAAYLAANV